MLKMQERKAAPSICRDVVLNRPHGAAGRLDLAALAIAHCGDLPWKPSGRLKLEALVGGQGM